MDQEVSLRIVVVNPPVGARFAVQRGKDELLKPCGDKDGELIFEFPIRVRDDGAEGSPNFLGPFAQGPRDARFVYINSGMMAGSPASPWTRRAKIPLRGITWATIEKAKPGSFIEAKIAGTGRDGGPACATVPLLDRGWKLQ
jgi:hypothetical protein